MLEYEEALQRILAAIPPPMRERIDLAEAINRVLIEPIVSPIDLPPFDNSAVDGYAVRAKDVGTATVDAPTRLRLIGRVAAGEKFEGQLENGTCIRLFTGSPLPRGADAVVMQEDTSADAKQPEEVLVLDAVKPWENVRFHGEDIKTGNVLARPGQIPGGALSSLLAAAGIKEVTVGRRPVVGLLATGSELREAGQPLAAGEIYESNRIGLAALLSAINCLPKVLPLVADVKQRVRAALEDAFKECEVVVSTGGVSVGEFDFIKGAFEGIGGELQFWRVAIKPGRPFVFGRYQRKFLFGLPGNPVSALVTFALLVRPALLRWQGAPDVLMASHPGILAETMNNPGPRRHFMRVKIDQAGKIWSAGVQASHVLSSLAAANGLVDVPAEGSLSAGTAVQVLRWE